jgi:FAD:protein FMN transferase
MRYAERRWLGRAVIVLLAPALLQADPLPLVERQRYAMGTMFAIVVHHADVAAAERAVGAALDEVVRLDEVLSHYKAESSLSRLNREGRSGFTDVQPDLYAVIEASLAVSRQSGGRFDVTIAPLLRVWREARAAGRTPSDLEIAAASRCVGYQHIETRAPNRIRFTSDCLELDLGGIGKGYAVDRAMEVLASEGIRHAVVNAGGSTIAASGAPPGQEGWPVGLGAPVAGQRVVLLRDEALSTSQQHLARLPFAAGGVGEIIDPQDGVPTTSRTVVSVLTTSATDADALSTTLLLLSPETGKAVLAQYPSVSALWMSPAGELQDSYRASRLRLTNLE